MKKIKNIVIMLLGIALISGCALKYDGKVNITEDGVVTLEAYAGFDKELITALMSFQNMDLESEEEVESEEPTDAEIKEFMEKEFKDENGQEGEVTIDGDFYGYKMSKTYANIDDISTSEDVVFELYDNEDDSSEKRYMFKKEDGTYYGNFVFDASDEEGSNSSSLQMIDSDMTFTVTLPLASINDNADSKSNDGKTLTWNLDAAEKKNITFSFRLKEDKGLLFTSNLDIRTIMKYGGFALISIVIIVIIILFAKKTPKVKKAEPITQTIPSAPPSSVTANVDANANVDLLGNGVLMTNPNVNTTDPMLVNPSTGMAIPNPNYVPTNNSGTPMFIPEEPPIVPPAPAEQPMETPVINTQNTLVNVPNVSENNNMQEARVVPDVNANNNLGQENAEQSFEVPPVVDNSGEQVQNVDGMPSENVNTETPIQDVQPVEPVAPLEPISVDNNMETPVVPSEPVSMETPAESVQPVESNLAEVSPVEPINNVDMTVENNLGQENMEQSFEVPPVMDNSVDQVQNVDGMPSEPVNMEAPIQDVQPIEPVPTEVTPLEPINMDNNIETPVVPSEPISMEVPVQDAQPIGPVPTEVTPLEPMSVENNIETPVVPSEPVSMEVPVQDVQPIESVPTEVTPVELMSVENNIETPVVPSEPVSMEVPVQDVQPIEPVAPEVTPVEPMSMDNNMETPVVPSEPVSMEAPVQDVQPIEAVPTEVTPVEPMSMDNNMETPVVPSEPVSMEVPVQDVQPIEPVAPDVTPVEPLSVENNMETPVVPSEPVSMEAPVQDVQPLEDDTEDTLEEMEEEKPSGYSASFILNDNNDNDSQN